MEKKNRKKCLTGRDCREFIFTSHMMSTTYTTVIQSSSSRSSSGRWGWMMYVSNRLLYYRHVTMFDKIIIAIMQFWRTTVSDIGLVVQFKLCQICHFGFLFFLRRITAVSSSGSCGIDSFTIATRHGLLLRLSCNLKYKKYLCLILNLINFLS